MIRKTVAGLALALTLIGCGGGNHLTQGEIINKAYHPEERGYTMVCVAYGQYGCSSWMPISHTEPEHWKLQIVGRGEDIDTREWHEVPESLYNEGQVGQWVDLEAGQIVPR